MRIRVRVAVALAVIALAVPVALTAGGSGSAGATSAPIAGTIVAPLVSGLPSVPPPSTPFEGIGPFGLVFDGAHHLLASDADDSGFYSFGAEGTMTPSPITVGDVQTGLAFTANGDLFSALFQAGNIDQIDPTTGALLRQLNPPGTPFTCASSLTTDPATGDLFFAQPSSIGCNGATGFTRIENPTSADPTFVSVDAAGDGTFVEMAAAPDGTLYGVQEQPDSTRTCAVRLTETSSPAAMASTTLACFPQLDGQFIGIESIAVSPRRHGPPILFVGGRDGTVSEIDPSTTPATVTPIVTLATRIDGLVVGPDGCLYVTQSSSIDKLTNADGSCSLTPMSVLPALRIHPDGTLRARVGRPVLLAANITNAAHRAGTPITFTVTGTNPTQRTVVTNRFGVALFAYSGVRAGVDSISATATSGSVALASTVVAVDWRDSRHG